MSGSVIYLVRSWPRLSQTFIVNEVLALERRGVPIELFSMVHSGEHVVQPQVSDVQARVRYLDEPLGWRAALDAHRRVLMAAPLRYLRTVLFATFHPGLSAGYATASVWGCLQAAVRISATLLRLSDAGRTPTHLHAHFAHDPALVALLVHRLSGLTYTFTAHARDLLQIPAPNLARRAAEAAALVTCCQANADYIDAAVPATSKPPVRVVRHGVDLDQFRPAPAPPESATPTLVTVGRLVEKKGFGDLLQALSQVKASGHAFTCRLYGDGPLRQTLLATRDRLGLTEEVALLGEQDREQIVAALTVADAFVLTPILTDDGDRDGIPNVLVEAMACAVPVVSTTAGGIPELVHDGVNGLLTVPGDVAAVATRIEKLLDDPHLRRALGSAGRRTVEADYNVNAAAGELAHLFTATAVAGAERTR